MENCPTTHNDLFPNHERGFGNSKLGVDEEYGGSNDADEAGSGILWPRLAFVGLSRGERASRLLGLGGSDANIVFSRDSDRILRLWREKRVQAEPEDLSANLAVMLGTWTEDFNRQWYEMTSGHQVTRAGESISCSENPWRRCTLDGFIEARGSIFEAKHTSAFVCSEQVLERYMPQLQHNMAVTRASRAVLSVLFGNQKYTTFEVEADWMYQRDLLQAEHIFWSCVQTGKRPVPVDPPAPPKPVGTREVCLEGNNQWASAAVDWLQHRNAARKHTEACLVIKGLVEPDVKRAFGHGIHAKRSKSGAITIGELV